MFHKLAPLLGVSERQNFKKFVKKSVEAIKFKTKNYYPNNIRPVCENSASIFIAKFKKSSKFEF